MLQLKTIEAKTLELLRQLQQLPILKNTRLVGGTALSLQLGHRKSIDLDIFGEITTEFEEIINSLNSLGKVEIIKTSKNINIFWIDGIKVDLVNYPYKWIDDLIEEAGLRLAGIKDIAAMKIAAIINRGTKKDFIDLYFLTQRIKISDILNLYLEKYHDGSSFIAIKSLTYFEDAENDPMPYMFTDIGWEEIKSNIIKDVQKMVMGRYFNSD